MLYPIKVVQFHDTVHTQHIYNNLTYPLPASERSINTAYLNFLLAQEYQTYVENRI
jgi:hypothetical protein